MIQAPMKEKDRPSCHKCGKPMEPVFEQRRIAKCSCVECCSNPENFQIKHVIKNWNCPVCGATTEPS